MGKTNKPKRSEIADLMLEKLGERGIGKTICPSEVAKALSDDWRPLMPVVREVADSLSDKIEVTQKGQVVGSAVDAKGPIRLRLK